jgi:hypothetical protein
MRYVRGELQRGQQLQSPHDSIREDGMAAHDGAGYQMGIGRCNGHIHLCLRVHVRGIGLRAEGSSRRIGIQIDIELREWVVYTARVKMSLTH